MLAHHERLAPLLAAALGALFFMWIAGGRPLAPTETTWSMQGDWRVHFLGWQFFRHEPWHVPPGRIDRYFAPLGTSIGLTDSIPIAAFALKPFSRWLSPSFQYLGLWLCLCFALQGAFGALLVRLWTSNAAHQLLGAMCFVLVPTLLMRTLHPALCAHWLILWAIWLYVRTDRVERAPFAQTAALALVAGLVHPYLALMVMALLSALGVRLWIVRRAAGLAMIAIAICVTLGGWWLSGLFTVSGASVLGAEGLREHSMNLLGPITPTGWSTLLPEIPIGANGQLWEGFQYLGAGLLLLLSAAAVVSFTRSGTPTRGALHSRRVVWPLGVAAATLAIYALSPRVTFGSAVVFELTSPWIDRLSMFRAAGRFFWPAAYLLLTMALAAVVSRLTPRLAAALLCAVLVIQLVDLHEAHASRRHTWRSDQLFEWRPSLRSPVWERVLPYYSNIIMYPPSYCGGAPAVDTETVSYLAGMYGLSINAGFVARFDEADRRSACERLVETLLRGEVDDATIYVGRPGEIDLLKARARQPLVCAVVDHVSICATAKSYESWRDVARLE